MSYLVTEACTACGACLLTCPAHAIVPTVPLQVRADRCTRCGECVEVCPADALTETTSPGFSYAGGASGVRERRGSAGIGGGP
jgi:ferredoxin